MTIGIKTPIAGKIAIYLRQSKDREGRQVAVSRQREDCRALCQREDWDMSSLVEYMDNDTSASTGYRPEYQQMLTDIESGAIGAVVCYHLDRLHRQPKELEHFIDLCNEYFVKLANVTGEVDLSTDTGRLIARIMGAVARAEIERKSARQKRANKQRAENGKAWNVRVFGYNNDKLVKNEADAIRHASLDLIDGASLYGIAAEWNKAGLRTPKGFLWDGTTVRGVLTRPRNAGLAVHDVHGANRAAKGKSLKERVNGAILEGKPVTWPAIVDRDTFNAVLTTLSNPKRHSGKRRARIFLLSGLAYCGLCGHKMGTSLRTTKAGAKRAVYQCKYVGCMKVARDQARTDKWVVDVITDRLAQPDAAQAFARNTVDTTALSAQAAKFRGLIAAAEREHAVGDITGRDLKIRRDTLQPKINAIEDQLVGANTSRKLDGLLGNPDAAKVFASLSLDRQRAVIDTCAVVTVMPTVKAGGLFDPELITVESR